MSSLQWSTGNVLVGEPEVIYRPRLRQTQPLVVYMHSASGLGDAAAFVLPAIEKLLSGLADRGHCIVCPAQILYAWGADVGGQDRVTAAVTYGRNVLGQSGPIILIGTSMGSLCALRYAGLNPALVACVVTWLTIPSLDYVYQNNIASWRSQIETHYGVTWPAPLPANADPNGTQLRPNLAHIPLQLWHSRTDTYSDSSSPFATFATATHADARDTGTQGHTDASIAATDVDDMISFIHRHIP